MKRLSLLILFAVLLALPALSQQISVESFTPLENDMTANTAGTMKKDQNGKTCALIKVVTSEKGFNFDVGILGVVATEQKVGEIWVYVPEKIRFITIAHPQLGVLRNYPIPQQVESARTYELRLVTGKVHTVIEEAQTDQFVVFHISPADAILEFDGQPLLLDAEGSASCFKPFGKYQYRIERKDYHTEAGSVTVTAEKASVNVNMRPMFGWLEVNSANAGSDARVFVDGSDHGTLPLHTLQLGSGKHLLKIIKPLYHIFQQSVTIADNDTLRVNAALKSDFRNYTITGDADADIYINQEYKGHGSWSGPLASGTYRVELRKPSHRTTIRSITINADDLSANDIISLPAPTPIYGSLKVTSSPMEASVAIDGKVMGKTPLFIKEVLIGSRSVTLSKDGYKTETATADIDERKTSELNIVLSNAIRVKFTSNVTSVVNIDGKYIGLTPCDALLTCTKHEISMSADRYQSRTPNCDVIICVPFTHLASVKAVIDDSKLGLGAENCADKAKGAFTGEVSGAMVASTGAKYVILGHSERRQYYHETSEILKEKVALAFENGLTPIFCIGEVLEERENGTYFDVVKKQVEDALFHLSADDFKKIILAYEPVWAIGTGKTATADQAEEIHAFIRKTIADKYGNDVAEEISILYGGSCKPSNAKEIFSKTNVDGGLIGGAALKAEDFMGIVDAF